MTSLNEAVIMAAAFVGALSVIFGGVWAVYRVARRVEDAIGKDKHGQTIADRMGRVEHQLWPNGGSSLADKVAQVEKDTLAVKAEQEVILSLLHTVVEQTAKKPRVRKVS